MNYLFKLYLFSFSFFTLANYGGFIPLSSVIILVIFILFIVHILYKKKIRYIKFDNADKILSIFLIVSFLSYFISSKTDLNFNHLISHYFVFIFFYLFIKIYLFNLPKNDLLITLSNYFKIIFHSIVLTSLVDYVLFGFGINLANYLPLQTRNVVFGESWGVRARGFFVEPTDLALALNIYGPIYIGFNLIQKKYAKVYTSMVLYVTLLILTRSASGFFEILCSLFLILCYFLFYKKEFKIIITYALLKKIFFVFSILILCYFIFEKPLGLAILEFTRKFDFVTTNFETGDVRVEYWVDAVSLVSSFNTHEFLIGSGTGFTSWNLKTFNWYLTVFIENGFIGIFLIFLFFFYKLYRCFRLKSDLKFFYFIAVFSSFLHLFSQVGYFYPYVWFPLATLDIIYNRLNTKFI